MAVDKEAIKAVGDLGKKAGGALVAAGGVYAIVELGKDYLKRRIEAGAEAHDRKADLKKSLVKMPEIIGKDYVLKLEHATVWIEDVGLKPVPVVAKPDIKYKDFTDQDVVDTNYKNDKKVEPGTHIILQYVTSEVIEKSRMLFVESEKEKKEKEQKKEEQKAKRAEQIAQGKQKLDDTVEKLQDGAKDVAAKIKEGADKKISNIKKKEGTNEKPETITEEPKEKV